MTQSTGTPQSAAPSQNVQTPSGDAWILSTDSKSPVSGQEISQAGYPGSMQQVLLQNVGYYVSCEFLIGPNNVLYKEGVLHAVSNGWMSLFVPSTKQYIVCDIYSVKFVTFYPPGSEPTIPRH